MKCPLCEWKSGEVEVVLAAAMLTAHSYIHNSGQQGNTGGAKPPPVERPKLQAACPKADWGVFLSRWRTFKAAVNIRGGHFAPSVLIFLALWFPPFLFTP